MSAGKGAELGEKWWRKKNSFAQQTDGIGGV